MPAAASEATARETVASWNPSGRDRRCDDYRMADHPLLNQSSWLDLTEARRWQSRFEARPGWRVALRDENDPSVDRSECRRRGLIDMPGPDASCARTPVAGWCLVALLEATGRTPARLPDPV
jgi:hypothetical protein